MDKIGIIKMELEEWFDLDAIVHNILYEGCNEVSSSIHSTYRAMQKTYGEDKETFEKYRDLYLDSDLRKNIKLILIQSLRDRLDKEYAEITG